MPVIVSTAPYGPRSMRSVVSARRKPSNKFLMWRCLHKTPCTIHVEYTRNAGLGEGIMRGLKLSHGDRVPGCEKEVVKHAGKGEPDVSAARDSILHDI